MQYKEDDSYEIILHPFDIYTPNKAQYLTVEYGEKFSIPDNYEYGTTFVGCSEIDFKIEVGYQYSIQGREIIKYLSDGIEVFEFFTVSDKEGYVLPWARFSLGKYRYDALMLDNNELKWGYIYGYDGLMISAEYDEATDPNSRGVAAVKKGNNWHLIFLGNEKINEEYYDDIDGPYFDYFSFAKKEWGTGRGIIDSFGQVICKPSYDTMPIPIFNNLFLTCENGKIELVDFYESNTIN